MISHAFIGSGLIFAYVLYTLKFLVFDFQKLSQGLMDKPFLLILLLYSVLMFIFSNQVSKTMLNLGVKNLKNRNEESLHQVYFTSFIVKNALIESSYLIAFAISFLIQESTLFVVIYSVAALMIYKGIPTEASMKEDLRSYQL